jgi:hypothetical protein
VLAAGQEPEREVEIAQGPGRAGEQLRTDAPAPHVGIDGEQPDIPDELRRAPPGHAQEPAQDPEAGHRPSAQVDDQATSAAAAFTVAAAARRPARRRDLDDHPSRAVGAEPRRLQLPSRGAAQVLTRVGLLPALVAEHQDGHSVSFRALIGICSSPSRSMSDSAGRPSVVR